MAFHVAGRIPTVLVYALRGSEVLLMHRNKEPNLGLWVAPGGKIEMDESPYEAKFVYDADLKLVDWVAY